MSIFQLRVILLVLILVPADCSAASPNTSTPFLACTEGSTDKSTQEKNVKICTLLIESGQLQNGELAAVYTFRGLAYARTERLAQALMDEEEALQIAPAFPNAALARAQIYHLVGLETTAISELSQLLESNPNELAVYASRGQALLRIGEYARAILDLSEAIQLYPENPALLAQRGIAYLESHQLYTARADLNRAVALRPDFGEALYERGRLNLLERKTDAALADFKLAANSHDNFPNAESARSYIETLTTLKTQSAAAQSQPPDATRALVPSMAVPGTHDCAAVYPEVSRRRDESGDVMVSYDVEADGSLSSVALAQSSGYPRLDDAALWCTSTLFRNTPALDHGTPVRSPNHRAIIRFSLDGGTSETAQDFFLRGRGHLELGEYDDAEQALTQSIAMDPSNGDAYFCRGLARLLLGKFLRARDDFKQMVPLHPDVPDAADWLRLPDFVATLRAAHSVVSPRPMGHDI